MSLAPPSPPSATEIRAFRRAVGFSQANLSTALGVSLRTVEEWERLGSARAPAYLRYAFAAIMNNLPPWAGPLQISEDGDGFRVRVTLGDPTVAGEPVEHRVFTSRLEAEQYAAAISARRYQPGPKQIAGADVPLEELCATLTELIQGDERPTELLVPSGTWLRLATEGGKIGPDGPTFRAVMGVPIHADATATAVMAWFGPR